uniref:Uncharacterized protein n=1 Tax=Eutreptiella gymnastica TaxID=73025 RepID=A0A7S1J9Z9_9EUGL|mmetsp:Transcript_77257/g.136212  ORF Transcript_77257/g.136212 Transcript_77257/m.136212 type:complete len:502 (+) Transcript_77257:53-1558(+)
MSEFENQGSSPSSPSSINVCCSFSLDSPASSSTKLLSNESLRASIVGHTLSRAEWRKLYDDPQWQSGKVRALETKGYIFAGLKLWFVVFLGGQVHDHVDVLEGFLKWWRNSSMWKKGFLRMRAFAKSIKKVQRWYRERRAYKEELITRLIAHWRLLETSKQMMDRIAVLGNPQHGASEEQRMYQLIKKKESLEKPVPETTKRATVRWLYWQCWKRFCPRWREAYAQLKIARAKKMALYDETPVGPIENFPDYEKAMQNAVKDISHCKQAMPKFDFDPQHISVKELIQVSKKTQPWQINHLFEGVKKLPVLDKPLLMAAADRVVNSSASAKSFLKASKLLLQSCAEGTAVKVPRPPSEASRLGVFITRMGQLKDAPAETGSSQAYYHDPGLEDGGAQSLLKNGMCRPLQAHPPRVTHLTRPEVPPFGRAPHAMPTANSFKQWDHSLASPASAAMDSGRMAKHLVAGSAGRSGRMKPNLKNLKTCRLPSIPRLAVPPEIPAHE